MGFTCSHETVKIRITVLTLWAVFFFTNTVVHAGILDNLQPGQWVEVPNSNLSKVLPSPLPAGSTGPAAIMSAWSGATYDTKRDRLVVWGGGHGDYAGNELYTFDINSLTWARITDPSPAGTYENPPLSGSEAYSDGKPASRHTYDAMEYLPTQDRLWSAGGSRWSGSGGGSNGTWYFDFASLTWTRLTDAPVFNVTTWGGVHPTTGKIYQAGDKGLLAEYDPANGVWTKKLSLSGFPLGEEMVGAIDPNTGAFVSVGNGYMWAYYPVNNTYVTPIKSSGPQNIVNCRGAGLVYDSNIKKLVGYCGGQSVYSLDSATWTWTEYLATNTVVPAGDPSRFLGFGRFNYIPSRNLYIWVNSISQNVWFYKLSSTTTTTAPPPTSQPPPSSTVSTIDLPVGQWFALDAPTPFNSGSKHVTGAYNPQNGKLYFTGGDYGEVFGGSYRQATWSLSLKDRWADKSNSSAGLTLEYPDCGPSGQIQPKHPDFVGWSWDSKRNVFWFVPGEMVISSSNCSGETVDRLSDPGFRWNSLMTFDPSAKTWAEVAPANSPFGDNWSGIYDAATDTVIRFSGYSSAKVDIFNPTTKTWTSKNLSGQYIDRAMPAADFASRSLYTIDPYGATLYRYQIDTQTLQNLGPIPGGPLTDCWIQPMMVWDSQSKVLLFYRQQTTDCGSGFPAGDLQSYNPNTAQWTQLTTATNLAGVYAEGLIFTYDAGQNAAVLLSRRSPGKMYLYRYGTTTVTTAPPQAPSSLQLSGSITQ